MTTDINELVRNHAMLVSVHIKHWAAKNQDPDAARVASQASGAAGHGAFKAIKNLMHQHDSRLKDVQKAGTAVRNLHIEKTMAWGAGRTNHRMLPIVAFTEYSQAVSKAKTLYETALKEFMDHYEDDSRKARGALNLPEDGHTLRMYPQLGDDLKSRFGLSVEFEPIATGTVFQNLPSTIAGAMDAAFEQRVTRRYQDALAGAYTHIQGLLVNLRENLQAPVEDKAQRWKDSSITNIIEAERMLNTFDLTDSEEHRHFCSSVRSHFNRYDDKKLIVFLRKVDAVDDRLILIDRVALLEVELETLMEVADE